MPLATRWPSAAWRRFWQRVWANCLGFRCTSSGTSSDKACALDVRFSPQILPPVEDLQVWTPGGCVTVLDIFGE